MMHFDHIVIGSTGDALNRNSPSRAAGRASPNLGPIEQMKGTFLGLYVTNGGYRRAVFPKHGHGQRAEVEVLYDNPQGESSASDVLRESFFKGSTDPLLTVSAEAASYLAANADVARAWAQLRTALATSQESKPPTSVKLEYESDEETGQFFGISVTLELLGRSYDEARIVASSLMTHLEDIDPDRRLVVVTKR